MFHDDFTPSEFLTIDIINKTNNDIITDPDIHIYIKQRGRKHITYVTNIPQAIDLISICKEMKKKFSCGGTTKKNEEFGLFIELSGDQRDSIKEYLVTHKLVEEKNIVIHGF